MWANLEPSLAEGLTEDEGKALGDALSSRLISAVVFWGGKLQGWGGCKAAVGARTTLAAPGLKVSLCFGYTGGFPARASPIQKLQRCSS